MRKPGLPRVVVQLRGEAPEAGQPVGRHSHEERELEQAHDGVVDVDGRLPLPEDADGSQHAEQLGQAQQAEGAQRLQLLQLVALHHEGDEVVRNHGNKVHHEPGLEVAAGDGGIVLHPHHRHGGVTRHRGEEVHHQVLRPRAREGGAGGSE